MTAQITKEEVIKAVTVIYKKTGRPVSLMQVCAFYKSNPIPESYMHSARGVFGSIAKENKKGESPIEVTNVFVEGQSLWVPASAVNPDVVPTAKVTNVETVAPVLSNRHGVNLTVHQSCTLENVIKLEYRTNDGWSERQAFVHMDLFITLQVIFVSPLQTKELRVHEVRVTMMENGKQSNQSFLIREGYWVIVAPALT